jgi:hypothetical protein
MDNIGHRYAALKDAFMIILKIGRCNAAFWRSHVKSSTNHSGRTRTSDHHSRVWYARFIAISLSNKKRSAPLFLMHFSSFIARVQGKNHHYDHRTNNLSPWLVRNKDNWMDIFLPTPLRDVVFVHTYLRFWTTVFTSPNYRIYELQLPYLRTRTTVC